VKQTNLGDGCRKSNENLFKPSFFREKPDENFTYDSPAFFRS